MDVRKNPLLVLCFILCFSLLTRLSFGGDTISGNQSLSGDQTIVSAGGNFVLGFFKPGNSSGSNYYLGIWYGKVSLQTEVWVANRNNPISDPSSAELKLLDGNLVLFNESRVIIWSTNLNSTISNSTIAVMNDTGNFFLRDASNESKILWQSFDHPTHTWLPGAKLGLDKRTNVTQLLTSWKNSANPAEGLFSLELDPNGTSQYFILWNKTRQYWTSGTWNGQIFSLVPEMRSNYLYNFSYVSNDEENYFTYSMYDPTILSRFIMDISGQIKQLTWLTSSQEWFLFWSQPREQCQVYAYCGAFGVCSGNSFPSCSCLYGFVEKSPNDWGLNDYSSGCERRTPLTCENNASSNGAKDKFLVFSSTVLPENPHEMSSETDAACKLACLNNCSCNAYAYSGGNCSIWTEGLLNLQQADDGDSSAHTIFIRLAASELPSKSNGKKIVIGVVVGSVAVILLLGLVFLEIRRRRRGSVVNAKIVEGSLMAFSHKDLQIVTKNFSEKLGGGGFGSVFKGTLPDSTVIAVKKLESISQGEKQFRTEVSTIGTVQHVNLVRLRGFCSEGTEKLLVYDYMPNGSLDTHLFHGKEGSNVLDWKTRFQIALGIARGLAYLHEKCRDCIIHCDIKPENILLDANFCPKVADFGLAKLVGRDFSRVLTTMRGTRGYLAPEWISGVAITAKADVYSYGMMLFELISGRRNTEQSEDGKVRFFPTWAASKLDTGEDIFTILDSKLEGNADVEEVRKIYGVACWCIQDDEIHRPTMSQVVQILEGLLEMNKPPTPRTLQIYVDTPEDIVFFTESSTSQSSRVQSHVSTTSQAKSNASASDKP
ncbi:PAN/Apple domain [Dillenia turbinata]|uniref:Receptor-like serine/threonine-protein kinase n=1 Tax=Dillenia turbinata TaxID=194707 RepID=A0AAN8UTN3_9MAGN